MKNLLEQFIKNEVKSLLAEGQIERRRLSLPDIISKFKNKTFIFFDTETTTLDPKRDFAMITEIAGIAYDSNTGDSLGEYNAKAHLSPAVFERIKKDNASIEDGTWKGDPAYAVHNLLKMTKYYEESAPFMKEKDMLTEFVDFVNSFADKSPILVAHNAKFDMYFVGKSLERHNLPRMNRFPVLDTKALTANYLFPLLTQLKNSEDPEVQRLLASLKPAKKFINRLGSLGDAFQISTKHWHSAIADTEQLAGILAAVITFMDKHQGPV